MRNLKRVLSLALAAMMLLGMMVISSSAAEITKADFSDLDEITYKEAVEVMVALDVIDGMDDGSFDPEGILTREQAAKLLCYMLLGPDNAENLTTNTSVFPDVAADRWSAGYIAYCANVGILAGDDYGLFDPTGQLTGVAFGKMLLVALGYDPAVEQYVNNANWATNIAADMVNAGIAVNGVVLSNPLSREAAAQMAFQTLTANMVRYTSKPITVNGADGSSVVIAAGEAAPVSNSENDDYRMLSTSKDTTQQFCEKYFTRLKLNNQASIADNYGRPGAEWQYYGQTVTFKADEAVLTYTDTVSVSNATRDLKNYTFADVTPVVDGDDTAIPECTSVSALATAINGAAGKGVTVTVYVNDTNTISDVVVINTYIGKVTRVATSNGDTTVTVSRLNGGPSDATTFESTAFAKDDYVLYTVGEEGIESMELAEELTGEITATSSNYLRLDGTRYNHAKNMGIEDGTIAIGDATIYLDSNNNVVYVGKVESAEAQYLYVKGSDLYMNEASIRAVFADGTTQVVTVDGDTMIEITRDGSGDLKTVVGVPSYGFSATYDPDNKVDDATDAVKISSLKGTDLQNAVEALAGEVFAYTESDGEYKLSLDDRIDTEVTGAEISKNSNVITQASVVKATTDSSTTFIMTSSGRTYTGYRNVPNLSGVTMIAVDKKSGSSISGLVFISDSSEGDSEDAFYFFLPAKAKYESFKDGNDTFYTFTAYVNGEEQSVTVNNTVFGQATTFANGRYSAKPGVYKATKINAKDYVTAVDGDNVKISLATLSGIQATDRDSESLVLDAAIGGNDRFTYDSSTVFVLVEDNGEKVNVGSVTDIITYDAGALPGEEMTWVYVAETKGNSGNNAKAAKVVYIIADEVTAPPTYETNVPASQADMTADVAAAGKYSATIATTTGIAGGATVTVTVKCEAKPSAGSDKVTVTGTGISEATEATFDNTATAGTTTKTVTFKMPANADVNDLALSVTHVTPGDKATVTLNVSGLTDSVTTGDTLTLKVGSDVVAEWTYDAADSGKTGAQVAGALATKSGVTDWTVSGATVTAAATGIANNSKTVTLNGTINSVSIAEISGTTGSGTNDVEAAVTYSE